MPPRKTSTAKAAPKNTRSKANSTTTTTAAPPPPEQKPTPTPTKTFILPTTAQNDPNARLLTLPDPRSGELNWYFFSPDCAGLFEFTVISAPPKRFRSTLFTFSQRGDYESTAEADNKKNEEQPPEAGGGEGGGGGGGGAITSTAELWIATPVDIAFFMIPLLAPTPAATPAPTESQSKPNSNTKNTNTNTNTNTNKPKTLFQPLDDILDSQADDLHEHLRYVLYHDAMRDVLRERVEAVCDTVKAGEERMYRFSEMKLLGVLVGKAERVVAQGLPPSLEQRFVRRALAEPLMSEKREDVGVGENGSKDEDKNEAGKMDSTSQSAPAPARETKDKEENKKQDNQITHLLRLSTALTHLLNTYLPPPQTANLTHHLTQNNSPIDFTLLTNRLNRLAALRAEAVGSFDLTDYNIQQALKEEHVLGNEMRGLLKRKAEEAEELLQKKKRAGESRGVRELKKVNTTGMKKMSDFFGKK